MVRRWWRNAALRNAVMTIAPPNWVVSLDPDAIAAGDFANNRYWHGGTKTLAYVLTETRTGTAYALNSDGEYESFGTDVPRRTDLGLLVEPESIAKNTNYNANPTDLTNVSKGGDAASTLTVVDDSAALAAGGLDAICTSGNTYRLNNSGGASVAYAQLSGTVGNTNDHTCSVFARGTGDGVQVGTNGEMGGVEALTAAYQRFSATVTPTGSGNVMRVQARPGADVYFIVPMSEEAAAASSPIVTAGSTGTRPADAYVIDDPGLGAPYVLTAIFDDDSTYEAPISQTGDYTIPTDLDRPVIAKYYAVPVIFKDSFAHADETAAEAAGWTFQNTAATFSGGEMTLTNSATGGRARHTFPVESGKNYRATVTVVSIPNGGNFASLRINNAADSAIKANSGNVGAGDITLDFTADETGDWIADLRHGANPSETVWTDFRIVER